MGKFIFSSIVLGLGGSILGGVAGLFVDHLLGTSPWLALAASFLGLSISFFAIQVGVQKIFVKYSK